MVVIGIDPGKSGGISAYDGENILFCKACPDTPRKMHLYIKDILKICRKNKIHKSKVYVYIENVHAFPTDTKSSSFKFGTNFGMWLGVIGANNLKLKRVQPRIWMKHYGELPKEKLERKRLLKEIAQGLFDNIKITLKTADAILITKYGYEKIDAGQD